MSSSLKTRLITAAVAIPLLIVLIFFLSHYNHLAFSILIVLVTFVGSWELHNNILKKVIDVPFTGYLGTLLPIVELFKINYLPNIELSYFALACFLGISFLFEIFNGAKDNYKKSIYRIAATALNIVYPGLLMSYAIRICYLPSPSLLIFLFLFIVFGSDSLAYFTGMLFGKNNKGLVKCSPNKSIAGFAGGILLPPFIGVLVTLINPSLIPYTTLQTLILFFLTSLFGTLGDLFESLLKRSASIKDAGFIIPGRGGILDCIDSISLALPIFVALSEIILL